MCIRDRDHRRDISSTYIREELEKGNVEKANQLLGQPYAIHGEVVQDVYKRQASDNTKKKFTNMCTYYKVPIYLFGTKDELGHAMGQMCIRDRFHAEADGSAFGHCQYPGGADCAADSGQGAVLQEEKVQLRNVNR